MCDAVGEDRGGGIVDLLAGDTAQLVAVGVVPAHAAVQLELILQLIVDVGTHHLGSVQTLTLLTPSATAATAWEAHVVDIVGTREEHHLQIVFHHGAHASTEVTAVGSDSEIDIGHETLVHTWFDTEVEHRFFLSVLDTTDTREVALLIVGLDAVDDVGGQVLEGGLRVACHELLAIHEDLLDFLSVDLDGSVVIDLGTRETLHEFFHHRTFWCTEGAGIIHKGVGLQRHLRGPCRHRGALQHDGIGLHGDGTGGIVLTVTDIDLFCVGLKSNVGDLQGIFAVAGRTDGEAAIHIRQRIGHDLLST